MRFAGAMLVLVGLAAPGLAQPQDPEEGPPPAVEPGPSASPSPSPGTGTAPSESASPSPSPSPSPSESTAPAPSPRPTPTPSLLLERGRRVYQEHCAPCHGLAGDGNGSAARWLKPRPRDFTRGLYKLRSTPNGALPSDEDLLAVIDRGMPGSSMPAWQDELGVADRRAVVDYIKSFSPRFARALAPPPVALEDAPTPAVPLAEGALWYQQLGCGNCHGPRGRGNGRALATLRDDWGRHIGAADLSSRLRSGGSAAAIYRVLMTGLNGTPMPSYADGVLTEREADLAPAVRTRLIARRLWAVARYVVSLRRGRGGLDWLLRDTPGRAGP